LVRQHDRPDLVEELLLILVELLRPRRRGGDEGESENEADLQRRAAGHSLGSLSEDGDSISVRGRGTRAKDSRLDRASLGSECWEERRGARLPSSSPWPRPPRFPPRRVRAALPGRRLCRASSSLPTHRSATCSWERRAGAPSARLRAPRWR